MKILHFSDTPLAGAPYWTSICLKKYANLDVECCNGKYRYADGREFPYEKLWPVNIHEYGIIHIHNFIPDYLKKELKNYRGKIVATFHSVPPKTGWEELLKWVGSENSYTICQPYQISQYKKLSFRYKNVLPTLIDIYDTVFKQEKFDRITINFAPSNKFPLTHPASKGYYEVVKILEEVSKMTSVDLLIYSNKPHILDLQLKAKSHIIIDDVVHSTFHLTSLFGLAGNCYVISGVSGKSYSVLDTYLEIRERIPIISANLKTLKDVLLKLIYHIEYIGFEPKGRKWMEHNYNPIILSKFYRRVYEKVLYS